METYAVVNKAQTKKKNDPDKDDPTVIPENDPEQDPYTAPIPRDNTYDVSKLDQNQLVFNENHFFSIFNENHFFSKTWIDFYASKLFNTFPAVWLKKKHL